MALDSDGEVLAAATPGLEKDQPNGYFVEALAAFPSGLKGDDLAAYLLIRVICLAKEAVRSSLTDEGGEILYLHVPEPEDSRTSWRGPIKWRCSSPIP